MLEVAIYRFCRRSLFERKLNREFYTAVKPWNEQRRIIRGQYLRWKQDFKVILQSVSFSITDTHGTIQGGVERTWSDSGLIKKFLLVWFHIGIQKFNASVGIELEI